MMDPGRLVVLGCTAVATAVFWVAWNDFVGSTDVAYKWDDTAIMMLSCAVMASLWGMLTILNKLPSVALAMDYFVLLASFAVWTTFQSGGPGLFVTMWPSGVVKGCWYTGMLVSLIGHVIPLKGYRQGIVGYKVVPDPSRLLVHS